MQLSQERQEYTLNALKMHKEKKKKFQNMCTKSTSNSMKSFCKSNVEFNEKMIETFTLDILYFVGWVKHEKRSKDYRITDLTDDILRSSNHNSMIKVDEKSVRFTVETLISIAGKKQDEASQHLLTNLHAMFPTRTTKDVTPATYLQTLHEP